MFFKAFISSLVILRAQASSCATTSYPVWFRKWAGNPDAFISEMYDFDLAYSGDLLTCGRLAEPTVAGVYLGYIRHTNVGGASDKWFTRYHWDPTNSLTTFVPADSAEIMGCKFMQQQTWGGINFVPTKIIALTHKQPLTSVFKDGGLLSIDASNGNVLRYTLVTKIDSNNQFNLALTA